MWIYLGILCAVSFLVTTQQNPKIDKFQEHLGHLHSNNADEIQGLFERLLGKERIGLFSWSVDPNISPVIGKDAFKLEKTSSGKIDVVGTSGVTIAWGLHYYLKTYCGVHLSWDGSQIKLPEILPEVDRSPLIITANDRFRYYQNVCTVGYSSVWWQWRQWEKSIDWMALNGINLALAFTGQEAIWQRVYRQFNLTNDEIDEHFGGPGFLPWSRMGNMRGWGGPLSSNWHNHTIDLQHRILKRMRGLGIIPVLPAFAGHVPRAFAKLFPTAQMTKVGTWNKFEDKYCCPYLVAPTDPLFEQIGQIFLQTYIDEFGTDHIYNCDTFNENQPSNGDLNYLSEIGRNIYKTMISVDPKSIWLMQGWLFVHDSVFWTKPRAQAFLTSVPIGKMLILDLQSEQFPQYDRLNSYFGQPFIWCMLHNFGGNLGMFGSLDTINKETFKARNNKNNTMVGTGLTMEGIFQNYVVYDLMNEMAYYQNPVSIMNEWLKNYSTRRYGNRNNYVTMAWEIMGETVYGFPVWGKRQGHYIITKRPSLKNETWTWYDPKKFFTAWDLFLKGRSDLNNSTLYRHDVVDVTRQALQLVADQVYELIRIAVIKNNVTNLRSNGQQLLELYDDLELILASGKGFLVGRWLKDAKSLATNEQEKILYELNAKNQITLWGPNGEIRDYANKQWSGVMKDYFKPRWALFLENVEKYLIQKKRINFTQINQKIFLQVEKPFTFSRTIYPTKPQGDCIEIASQLLSKWRPIIKSFYPNDQRFL